MKSSSESAFTSDTGAIIMSVILGLGLATLFRSACKGRECITIKPPPGKDMRDYTYKIDNGCYRYTAVATQCNEGSDFQASRPA